MAANDRFEPEAVVFQAQKTLGILIQDAAEQAIHPAGAQRFHRGYIRAFQQDELTARYPL